jgi:excinuclease ABC subunit C
VYEQRNDLLYVIVFNVSKGVLLNKQSFEFDALDSFEDFIVRLYDEQDVPREIIVPVDISAVVKDYLEAQRKGVVTITVPQQGLKKNLLDLAFMNLSSTFFAGEERVKALQEGLKLPKTPRVIECFDISHLSGTHTVASMVQFKDGMPNPSNYRRFKITTVDGIDDFRSMEEVVYRRYSRLQRENKSFPDLIVIDGGKGQLKFAGEALRRLDARIPLISLAKREEEVFLPGRKESILLSKTDKGIHLLQHIRDEAHRFAITYNRLLRKKSLKD